MFKLLIKYLQHLIRSRGKKGYGIHSPFIFKLVTGIVYDFTPFYCYKNIEDERKKLLVNKQLIQITDYGAGSNFNKGNERSVKSIAKHSLKPSKQAQLLFRLINHLSYTNILEIGGSLGVTTSYLASVNSKSKVISCEGCLEQIKIAQELHKKLDIKNVQFIQGDFEQTLTQALSLFDHLDFVFFDGNHTKKATMSYYLQCLPKANNNSMFVFDDIHMNPDMEDFWNELILRPEITIAIDLFHMGIVFFKKEITKQKLSLRF